MQVACNLRVCTVTDLVKTLAPQVPQGLLQAEGQRLSRTLHMHNERHSEHILILIVWYLHSLHELWDGPRRDINTCLTPCFTGSTKDCDGEYKTEYTR